VIFAAAVSLAVVLLASLLPGRTAARSHPAGALQQSSRSGPAAGGRAIAVVARVAVT
jgi:hypothetical protein